jgi:hypothetical protein
MNGSGQGEEEVICVPRDVEHDGQHLVVWYQCRASAPDKYRLWKIATKHKDWDYINAAIRYVEEKHEICQSLAHAIVYDWVKKDATPEPPPDNSGEEDGI